MIIATRCALLIVDFNKDKPKLYNNSEELKDAGIISKDFIIEQSTLSFNNFAEDLLKIYADRFNINDICK